METNHSDRGPVLPLVGLLALASALGVAVAVALAGVAMLLAAPAYAQEGRMESDEERHGRHAEVYTNLFDEPLEGIYVFRLPPNAVLERFRLSSEAAEFEPALPGARRVGRYASSLNTAAAARGVLARYSSPS